MMHDDHHQHEHDDTHEAHDHEHDHSHDDGHDHEPYVEDYFLGEAMSVERLSPSLIRVVLKIAGGERLIPSGHADEWVRLALRPDADTPVTLPVKMEDGEWGRPDGSKHCPNRPYTVRRWDAASHEMVIDVVVHEGGVAASWALGAQVGDVVGICNPEGRLWVPKGSQWILMLTDITGLPAVGRVLEELPTGFKAIVHVEVPCEADKQEIVTQADVSTVWHVCHGLRDDREGYTELPRIAGEIKELPEGSGYIYIAGEARAASACRKHFRDVLGFDKKRIDAIGYWIEGQARV
ncbi:siderophore-interacting protein [Bacillus subtilis]|uniref:siderophore-interacting protein n=1 Tax=Pseudochrobactrum asaccharolyticum TaxID=354351 RepID=UPI001F34D2BC|nr:siderophore-interacting protein [Pseudochrobactrum asaccharolyticum]MCF7647186.1 siderophore-interacting protein [Pseudochrobactrum asaccharolyticum]MCF7673498.1 siderophore-interacting protein [Bacillus subtilis]